MNTDFAAYAEYLEIVSPEVVERFDNGYEDPKYEFGACQRCGSLVPNQLSEGIHNAYHRALSLTLFVFGSTMQSITNLLEVEREDAPEEKRTEVESNQNVCKNCGFKDTLADSRKWYKCCPTHTPQNSNAVMCEKCTIEFHAIQMPEEYRLEENGGETNNN